ncbi:DUF3311 domain-containing protein [Calidifontibacter sp. DB0510]|uniref:DUF3311 domain-containing protein n=1 Tax=Metallococcus carri TaxID=1656884 RepID=A0A967EGB0_9MICO|nr:DUF3311 domain-containing protein [Metallococcus carri]NHN54843.1 DUF3311 domain-containing protein [Metallococcus carri]NOP37188.1 DUF3311 domain-containing protein [Calidifontibacter sp. DB2511S]
MGHETKSVLVALVIPVVGILAGVLLLSGSTASVLGFPAVLVWLFAWMPITALLMHIAWVRWDREDIEALDAQWAEVGGR